MPEIGADEPRWVLVEAQDEILPEIGGDLGAWAARGSRERGIEIKTGTRLDSVEGGVVRLSDGDTFPAETLVWTAGVKPEPLAVVSGLPADDHGRLRSRRRAGRGARGRGVGSRRGGGARPRGQGLCPPSAQYATRRGGASRRTCWRRSRVAPSSLSASRALGSLCSLGRYRGRGRAGSAPARVPGVGVTRSYHLLQLPTVNRKVRVVLDWTLSLFFLRDDVAALGSLHDPTDAFERASEG